MHKQLGQATLALMVLFSAKIQAEGKHHHHEEKIEILESRRPIIIERENCPQYTAPQSTGAVIMKLVENNAYKISAAAAVTYALAIYNFTHKPERLLLRHGLVTGGIYLGGGYLARQLFGAIMEVKGIERM